MAAPSRKMSNQVSGNGFKAPNFKDAWCSDTGAYPVMFVIGFACIFSLGYGASVMMLHPDARLGKGGRKSIFRGELRGSD